MFWFQFNYQQSRSHSTKPRYAQHSCGSGHTPAAQCLLFPTLKPFWKYPSAALPWANPWGLTWFTWAVPQVWGSNFTFWEMDWDPLHANRDKAGFWKKHQLESPQEPGFGEREIPMSQEDTGSSHETDLKAEIKKQIKWSSSLFRGERSHLRPEQEQLFPQMRFSMAGTSPS